MPFLSSGSNKKWASMKPEWNRCVSEDANCYPHRYGTSPRADIVTRPRREFRQNIGSPALKGGRYKKRRKEVNLSL
jgi:hypothetical protein